MAGISSLRRRSGRFTLGGTRRPAPRQGGNHRTPCHVHTDVESECRLVALRAIDDRQYVYRVYAPADALPADLFWDACTAMTRAGSRARGNCSTRR
jgi:hypothetical protein